MTVRLNFVTENIAASDALDVAAEAEFQLRAVERRLLEFLLGSGERFDLEHHEGVSGRVRGFERRKIAFERSEIVESEDAFETESSRNRRVIVVGGIRQAGVRGRAIDAIG